MHLRHGKRIDLHLIDETIASTHSRVLIVSPSVQNCLAMGNREANRWEEDVCVCVCEEERWLYCGIYRTSQSPDYFESLDRSLFRVNNNERAN
ncbi:hypothetical protein WN55_04894 [Dufourea novaeangliae]|uniref:Uncharacterized protein n=1 Tax=Dufourea novaeangliae TaxID=178035 RepID=A0A154PMN5_DUFNO|nr:hypothetical protein WN55_04894 [Dufourea novaeangliae]